MQEPEKEVRHEFEKELRDMINRRCMEGGSDTPDFILAKYLTCCLEAFDQAVQRRDEWYSAEPFKEPEDNRGRP